MIRFDESLTNQLPVISNSTLSVFSINFTNYHRDEILLYVEQLQTRTQYEFTFDKIYDCAGNISDGEEVQVILPEPAEFGDILLSEILFNPRTNGVDFIEVYNNSAKYISLVNWQLSNGTSMRNIPVANVLNPYSYRVFTESPIILISEYPNSIKENMLPLELPSMPNEYCQIPF